MQSIQKLADKVKDIDAIPDFLLQVTGIYQILIFK